MSITNIRIWTSNPLVTGPMTVISQQMDDWWMDGWIDRQMDRWMTYKPAEGSTSMEAYNLWQTDRWTNKPRGWPLQKHMTSNRQTDLQASGSTPMEAHISWKLTLNSGSFLMSSLCLAANSSRFTLNVSICLAIYNILSKIYLNGFCLILM